MKKFLETLIVILITTVIISFSFLPVIKNSTIAPPNTVYTMVHNYTLDYYIYLSFIVQGQQGNLLAHELHTSEPHLGSLSHILYLGAGWITGPLNLPPFIVYQLLRLVSAVFLALTIYWFISLFFKKPKDRILAFFLSYASTGLPLVAHLTQLDGVKRSAFLPHWTFENALFLLALGFIFKNKIITSGVIIFILNLFSPFHSGIILISYFTFILLSGAANIFGGAIKIFRAQLLDPSQRACEHGKILLQAKKIFANQKIFNLLTLILFFLPSFIYINLAYSSGPLLNIRLWEARQFEDINFFLNNYLLTIGPTIFIAPLGALIAIKRGGIKNLSILTISIIVYLLLFSLPLTRLLGISNFRFHNFPTFVFLGIFSFYVISQVKYSKVRNLIFAVIIIISSVSYYQSYKQLSAEGANFPYNHYVPRDLYDGFLYLKETSDKKKDVVLTGFVAGNMLPGVSGNRVFIGHQVSTINFQAKQALVEKFFSNQMTLTEAQKFLKDNYITYVFIGPEESGFTPSKYSFLKPVFDRGVKIYKIY